MKVKGQFRPEKTICKWRWSYPVIHVNRAEIRTCDKTKNIKITEEMLQELGTDAFINNSYLKERRREKLVGLRHEDCFNCILLEDRGMQSSRTSVDTFTKYFNDIGFEGDFKAIQENVSDEMLRADHPDILEISLSNKCNLKCIYCSYVFSTAWEDEMVNYGAIEEGQRERYAELKPPSFDKYFWQWVDEIKGSLKRIIFIGGEPLLNDNFTEYLEKINDIYDNSDVKERPLIQIISNFNVSENKFNKTLSLLEKLTKKHKVHFEVSGESFGKRCEYIRHGLTWNNYTRNIEKLLDLRLPNFRFGLQMAINNLCVTSLYDLLVYAYELQQKYNVLIDYKENIVVGPEYLSVYNLSPDFSYYIEKCYDFVKDNFTNEEKGIFYDTAFREESTERWKPYLAFLKSIEHGIKNSQENSHLMSEFFRNINILDQRRDHNFLDHFPEYENFYKKCMDYYSHSQTEERI